jgi:hypothetical protein
MGSWAPQGAAPERRKPAPLHLEQPPTSSGAWILLALAVWLLALMCLGISVGGGFHAGTFSFGVALAAAGTAPVVHVVRRPPGSATYPRSSRACAQRLSTDARGRLVLRNRHRQSHW